MRRRFFFSSIKTRPDRDITLIVGDSNGDGRGSTIPTITPGALFNWNGASFDAITTQSVANEGGGIYGSIWQKYAEDYYNDTGVTTYLVNAALGGSDICPTGDDNDWSTTGDRYAAMLTKVSNALADGPGSVVTTIIVNLGINDVRLPATIGDITTHWNSLIDRLHADFPLAEILFINIGRTESVAFNQLIVQVRDLIVDTAHARDYCHMISSAAFYVGVSGAYNVDNLHYSQTTNDSIGVNIAKWRRYSGGYSKWARSIIAAHHTDIALSFRTKIQNLINDLGDDFVKIPYLTPLWSDSALNYLIDFTFRSYSVAGPDGLLQSPNGWMDTNNNVNNCLAAGYYTGLSTAGGSSGDDFNYFSVVGEIRTAAGVAAVLFGRTVSGSTIVRLAQGNLASPVNYLVNTTVARNYATDADILPDMLHCIGRLGGDEFYYQEDVQVDTVAQAKTADLNQAIWNGCTFTTTLEFPLDCDLGFVGAFPSSVNRSNLVAAVRAYLT